MGSRQGSGVSQDAEAVPAIMLEGAVMARVKGGWVVAQVSLPSDAPGLRLENPGELARPFALAQATGVFRSILGRVIQTLMARGVR